MSDFPKPPPPDWISVCDVEGRRVRKFPTYGGWLYQVQSGYREVQYRTREVTWTEPVFVPDDRRLSSPRVVR